MEAIEALSAALEVGSPDGTEPESISAGTSDLEVPDIYLFAGKPHLQMTTAHAWAAVLAGLLDNPKLHATRQ